MLVARFMFLFSVSLCVYLLTMLYLLFSGLWSAAVRAESVTPLLLAAWGPIILSLLIMSGLVWWFCRQDRKSR